MLISSAQNPKVKYALKLQDKRSRDKTQHFLVEGYRELKRAHEAGRYIETLFTCPELFLGSNEEALIRSIEGDGRVVLPCTEKIFRLLSYRDRPDGLLAIAKQAHLGLADLDNVLGGNKSPLLIVVEAIEKPGNLGTILRSADAVGVDAVIVCDQCTDIHNPNVVRASVGTLFTIPIIEAEGKEAMQWIRQRGISVLAATPSGEHMYTEANMLVPLAIAVGTEQLGLSPLWMEQATYRVRIPMRGVADSLNVAMATTLLLYEALRQRS
jgi:TrmH family RNA methyltransferase